MDAGILYSEMAYTYEGMPQKRSQDKNSPQSGPAARGNSFRLEKLDADVYDRTRRVILLYRYVRNKIQSLGIHRR